MKYCPFYGTSSDSIWACRENSCALWNEMDGRCSIVTISGHLSRIHYDLDDGIENIREAIRTLNVNLGDNLFRR